MRKKVGIIALGVISLACLSGGLLSADFSVQAQTVAYTSEVFSNSSGISFESAATDKNGNRGLAVNAFKNNSYVVLNEKTTGNYDFAFFGGQFSLVFEGDKGEFAINVNASGTTLSAGVELNGNKAGIFYNSGMPSGASLSYNRMNRFTELVVGEINRIIFRADQMCVYVSNGENELLVWDFTKLENDGHNIGETLFSFTDYSVTMKAPKSEEKTFIYELNGTFLETDLLVDRSAPTVYAPLYSNAQKGKDYVLPTPYAYDLFDGEIADINVKIKRGDSVLVHEKYEDGMTLENPSIGEYEIVYTAEDKSGNLGEYTVVISCNSVEETYNFVSSYTLENNEFGVGSTIDLPNIYYSSNYTVKNVPCALTVALDGTVCEEYNDILLYNQTLKFEEEGVYTVVFKPLDKNIKTTQTYTFTAKETLPSVQIGRFDVNVGDVLELPTITSNFGGLEYTYDIIAYYPDGKAYIGNTFEIDQAGQYMIEYRFDNANGIYSYQLKFSAAEKLYGFGKDASYAYIGECTYDKEQTGLNIVLSQSDVFTYSKIVDLSDNTKEDLLIELLMTPLMSGTQELQEFQIILTDVYNPENYITLDFLDHKTMRTNCYAKMAPAGEILSGYENENMQYWVNQWGTYFRTSLYGVKTEKDFPIKLWFDYESRQMFVSHGNLKRLISDLDDYNCYGNIWNGFTTGEVRITIKGVSWLASKAGMFLKTVDGEFITEEMHAETVAPKIDVNLLGYEENDLPIAVVGKGYSVFNATAFDAYAGSVKLYTNVYLNYGQSTQTQVSVIGGKFIPYTSGRYSIVYTAYDNYGNRAERRLTVDAVKNAPTIQIETLDSDSISVGKTYYLPTVSVSGGSGKLTVTAYAMIDGNYVEVDQYCIFETAGSHVVKFVAQDYIGNTAEYLLTVQADYDEKPIFNDVPVYPNVFISGKTYEVKEFTAKYYADNIFGETADMRVFLEYKNEKTEIVGNKFTPVVEKSGDTVKLVYEAKYGDAVETYSYIIPTVIVNSRFSYSMDKYFYVTDGSTAVTDNGATINIVSDESKVYYAQDLLADAFKLSFNVNPEKNAIGAIVIWLYDAKDIENVVKIKIVNTNSSASLVSINDGAFAEIKGSFMGTSPYAFELSYDNDLFVIKDADKLNKTVETNTKGEVFNGFASGLVRFDITFEDVTGETQLIVNTINNQTISNFTFDMVDPQAKVVGSAYERNMAIGSVVDVKNIAYSDVLSLNASVIYSVTFNGKAISSTDGVKLSNVSLAMLYSFTCENYGTYMVTYIISDDSGNQYYYSNVINVADDIKPTLTVDGNLANEYKQRAKITLPSASATDNLGGELTVFVAVYTPNGLREYLAPNDEYVFNQKGTYIVKYIVYDTIGNITEQSFEINVK